MIKIVRFRIFSYIRKDATNFLEFSPQLWWEWSRPLWFQYRTWRYFLTRVGFVFVPHSRELWYWQHFPEVLYREIDTRVRLQLLATASTNYGKSLQNINELDTKLWDWYDAVVSEWFGDTTDYQKRRGDDETTLMQLLSAEDVLKSK